MINNGFSSVHKSSALQPLRLLLNCFFHLNVRSRKPRDFSKVSDDPSHIHVLDCAIINRNTKRCGHRIHTEPKSVEQFLCKVMRKLNSTWIVDPLLVSQTAAHKVYPKENFLSQDQSDVNARPQKNI